MSLTALTERVDSDGAIPPGQKCFLLMCRYGLSGRVEQCVRFFAVMFAGSKYTQFAAECMHRVTCLTHTWKHQFKKAWMEYCLIDPNARPGIYCAVDRHGETIKRENKDQVCNACCGFQGRD